MLAVGLPGGKPEQVAAGLEIAHRGLRRWGRGRTSAATTTAAAATAAAATAAATTTRLGRSWRDNLHRLDDVVEVFLPVIVVGGTVGFGKRVGHHLGDLEVDDCRVGLFLPLLLVVGRLDAVLFGNALSRQRSAVLGQFRIGVLVLPDTPRLAEILQRAGVTAEAEVGVKLLHQVVADVGIALRSELVVDGVAGPARLRVVVHRAGKVDHEGDVAGIGHRDGRRAGAERRLIEDHAEEQRRLAAGRPVAPRGHPHGVAHRSGRGEGSRGGIPGAELDVGRVQFHVLPTGRVIAGELLADCDDFVLGPAEVGGGGQGGRVGGHLELRPRQGDTPDVHPEGHHADHQDHQKRSQDQGGAPAGVLGRATGMVHRYLLLGSRP